MCGLIRILCNIIFFILNHIWDYFLIVFGGILYLLSKVLPQIILSPHNTIAIIMFCGFAMSYNNIWGFGKDFLNEKKCAASKMVIHPLLYENDEELQHFLTYLRSLMPAFGPWCTQGGAAATCPLPRPVLTP